MAFIMFLHCEITIKSKKQNKKYIWRWYINPLQDYTEGMQNKRKGNMPIKGINVLSFGMGTSAGWPTKRTNSSS